MELNFHIPPSPSYYGHPKTRLFFIIGRMHRVSAHKIPFHGSKTYGPKNKLFGFHCFFIFIIMKIHLIKWHPLGLLNLMKIIINSNFNACTSAFECSDHKMIQINGQTLLHKFHFQAPESTCFSTTLHTKLILDH